MSCQPCGCDFEAGWSCDDLNCGWRQSQKQAVMRGEVRITDPATGGQKGSKLARFDLIPSDALWAVAEVYGRGALKYADRNWEKGYAWGLSVAALERHLSLWKQRKEVDQETGALHLAQVAWHALALLTFKLRGLGTDDRTKGEAPGG